MKNIDELLLDTCITLTITKHTYKSVKENKLDLYFYCCECNHPLRYVDNYQEAREFIKNHLTKNCIEFKKFN